MGVHVTWNEGVFKALEDEIERKSFKAAGAVRDRAKRIIRDEKRVDTGALMNSIDVRRIDSPAGGIRWRIFSDLNYAIYQHEGVKGPVVPRRAKVLRFKPSGSNAYVFARSTKGFEGIKFLDRALAALKRSDFK